MQNHTLAALEIPEDVWWSDEFEWMPVEQSVTRSLTGARIVQSGIKQKGRPITLTSYENGGWVPRSLVLALQAQRANPTGSYLLTLADGRSFNVAHDLERQFEAAPIWPAADLHADSKYRITLPLIEI
jgi:hypothetical protein